MLLLGAEDSRVPALRLQNARDLLDLEALDDVVVLDVGVAVERDAALEAFGDLLDVVLEAAQAADLAFPDLRAVAHEASAPPSA